MRIGRSIVVSVLVVLAAGVQAPAADVGAVGALPGGENVITQISDAMSRHVEVLSDLLDRLPEAARVGLKRALDSARQGRDLAMAALNAPSQPGPRGRDGRLDWTDVMRARRTVSFSFHESVSALRKLMREDSEPATAAAAEALPRIKKNRAVALRSFDRIVVLDRGRVHLEEPEVVEVEHPHRLGVLEEQLAEARLLLVQRVLGPAQPVRDPRGRFAEQHARRQHENRRPGVDRGPRRPRQDPAGHRPHLRKDLHRADRGRRGGDRLRRHRPRR